MPPSSSKLGRLPILKARMNPDLHMADELKNTGTATCSSCSASPTSRSIDAGGRPDPRQGQRRRRVRPADRRDPLRATPTGIAAWFIDTDYNEESFFVRHAYFLGANDPYKSLKTALRAEIDEEAWATLYCDTSRPFPQPERGRIAVKVINHFGDEVMKVLRCSRLTKHDDHKA